MENRNIISHIRHSDKAIQSNKEHSQGVAMLAERFTMEIGMPGWGSFLGLLHDKGKEKQDFQTYIRLMNDLPTESQIYKDKTHAYVGALLAKKIFPKGCGLVGFALAGHHAGMSDWCVLEELLKREIPQDVVLDDMPVNPMLPVFFKKMPRSGVNHLIRMLYSCLVDADYLDTEFFMDRDKFSQRGKGTTLNCLLDKLEKFLKGLEEQSKDTPINRIRKQVQNQCRFKADSPSGVYSLTVPTGGGKTLSSVLWALLHAVRNGKKRIILSIPYTSIITQTAAILKDIFGDENVLEHHSNIKDDGNNDETSLSKKLAAENWDFPIIVTTNVQLIESIYSSHPSSCRKLHNIANSVILFDEVQALPGCRLRPIIDALKIYNQFFGVSLLFTTASQPTLKGTIEGHRDALLGFDTIEEIIPSSWNLHEKLKRVQLIFIEEPMSHEEIASKIMQQHRVLCIVNTRKQAGEIFSKLDKTVTSSFHFHLSRMMCSEHLDKTLSCIKKALVQDEYTPIRVVSTQLVEAGVDMDFPVVFRQEAGLDSILQAAGRCNREGILEDMGKVEVFKMKGCFLPLGTIRFANQARLNMSQQEDWFSPKSIELFFNNYYRQIPSFDKRENIGGAEWSMEEMLYNVKEMMFDTADKTFNLIENKVYSVVVNYGCSPELVEQLKYGEPSKALFRNLSRFTVNLYERDFNEFLSLGMIEEIKGFYYLSDAKQYDNEVGLKLNNHWIEETLIL